MSTASTGADGTFFIPAWIGAACFTMYGTQPELIVYKPGYQALRLLNVDEGTYPTDDIHLEFNDGRPIFILASSRWDGTTIKLAPFGDDLGRYFDELMLAVRQANPRRCFWDEMRPAFLLAFQEERRVGSPYGYSYAGPSSLEDVLRAAYHPGHYPYSGGWTCGALGGYVQSLSNEADKTAAVPTGFPHH